MQFKKQDFLIKFDRKPQAPYYLLSIVSLTVILLISAFVALSDDNQTSEKVAVITNFMTALMLIFGIERTFRAQPSGKYIIFFRISLVMFFFIVICSLIYSAEIVFTDIIFMTCQMILMLSLFMSLLSLGYFIKYVNKCYESSVSLTLHDELTGLPNRRHLNVIFREFYDKSGTVCIIDIDFFKRINDSYGHETGDKILTAIGLIFQEIISNDVFVARTGGEEFCILISDRVNAKNIIETIKEKLTFRYNNKISITVSAGVARKYIHESFIQPMIDADDALYEAKRSGRNRIVMAKR